MTDNSNDGEDDDGGTMQPPPPKPPPPPSYLASFGMHLASILASSSSPSSRDGDEGDAATLMARASASKSGSSGGIAGPSSTPRSSTPAMEAGSFRWYWRTGPSPRPAAAAADSASAQRGRRRRGGREPEPAFVDVTFTFEAAPSPCISGGGAIPAPEIRAQFGALIIASDESDGDDDAHRDDGNKATRKRGRHGWYGRSEPLTMSQLRSHAEEVGFDLDGTDPHVVAGFVADALADFRGRAGGVGGRDADVDGGDGGKSHSHLVLGDDGAGMKKTGLVMHHSPLWGAGGTLVEWGGDDPSSSEGGPGTGYLGATALDMVLLSHRDDDPAPPPPPRSGGVGVDGDEREKEKTAEEGRRGEDVRSSVLGALEGWYRDAHLSSAAAAAVAEQAQTQAAAAASAAVAAPSSRTGDGGVRDDGGGGGDGGGVGARHPAAANALGYNKNDAPPSLLARRKEELEGRGNGDGDGGGVVRDVSAAGPDGIKAVGEGGCPKPPPPPPPRPPPSSRQRRSVGAATGRRKKKKKLTIGRM